MKLLTVAVTVLLLGCGAAHDAATLKTPQRLLAEFVSHRAMWERLDLSDYSYTIDFLCLCRDRQPVVIRVAAGKKVSGVYADDFSPLTPEELSRQPSIEELFDLVEEAITRYGSLNRRDRRRSFEVLPQYDPYDGYVSYTGIVDKIAIDAGVNYAVQVLYLR